MAVERAGIGITARCLSPWNLRMRDVRVIFVPGDTTEPKGTFWTLSKNEKFHQAGCVKFEMFSGQWFFLVDQSKFINER
jgi:hypothetical protein